MTKAEREALYHMWRLGLVDDFPPDDERAVDVRGLGEDEVEAMRTFQRVFNPPFAPNL